MKQETRTQTNQEGFNTAWETPTDFEIQGVAVRSRLDFEETGNLVGSMTDFECTEHQCMQNFKRLAGHIQKIVTEPLDDVLGGQALFHVYIFGLALEYRFFVR